MNLVNTVYVGSVWNTTTGGAKWAYREVAENLSSCCEREGEPVYKNLSYIQMDTIDKELDANIARIEQLLEDRKKEEVIKECEKAVLVAHDNGLFAAEIRVHHLLALTYGGRFELQKVIEEFSEAAEVAKNHGLQESREYAEILRDVSMMLTRLDPWPPQVVSFYKEYVRILTRINGIDEVKLQDERAFLEKIKRVDRNAKRRRNRMEKKNRSAPQTE